MKNLKGPFDESSFFHQEFSVLVQNYHKKLGTIESEEKEDNKDPEMISKSGSSHDKIINGNAGAPTKSFDDEKEMMKAQELNGHIKGKGNN